METKSSVEALACDITSLKQKTFMVTNLHALSAVKVSYLQVPVMQY